MLSLDISVILTFPFYFTAPSVVESRNDTHLIVTPVGTSHQVAYWLAGSARSESNLRVQPLTPLPIVVVVGPPSESADSEVELSTFVDDSGPFTAETPADDSARKIQSSSQPYTASCDAKFNNGHCDHEYPGERSGTFFYRSHVEVANVGSGSCGTLNDHYCVSDEPSLVRPSSIFLASQSITDVGGGGRKIDDGSAGNSPKRGRSKANALSHRTRQPEQSLTCGFDDGCVSSVPYSTESMHGDKNVENQVD